MDQYETIITVPEKGWSFYHIVESDDSEISNDQELIEDYQHPRKKSLWKRLWSYIFYTEREMDIDEILI